MDAAADRTKELILRFQVVHELAFEYSGAVFLEPHDIHLCPRSDGAQTLESFHLEIDPVPVGINALLDLEGNTGYRAWFTGEHRRLAVSASSTVQTFRSNPFDYLPDATLGALSNPYPKSLKTTLKPYLAFTPLKSIKEFTAPIVKSSGKNALKFLFQLNATIHAEFKKIRRESGPAWSPGKTLSMRLGACRDLSSLFSAACRANGLATRFVSGYFIGNAESEQKDLHAWVEVFIPGAGWRGYDPMNGLVTGEQHIAAAASGDFAAISPLVGSYRGSGVESKMRYSVRITTSQPSRFLRSAHTQ